MSTATKGPKDKLLQSNPRLIPRPTAASSARAARNATNRNLSNATNRHSPSRPSASYKGKNVTHKSDSKTEVKASIIPKADQFDNVTNVISVRGMEHEEFILDRSPRIPSPVIAHLFEKHDDTEYINVSENEINMNDNAGGPFTPTMSSRPNTPVTINRTNSPILPSGPHSPGANTRPQTPCPNSRPNTPCQNSRPQTPRSQPSKPQTPHTSRPTTPSHAQRHTTPVIRPNTPQQSTASRPRTPILNVPPSSRVLSPIAMCSPTRSLKDEDLRSTYSVKQKQYQTMKRELDLKQQKVLEAFNNLRCLREKLVSEGISGCGEGLQDLVLLNVADWTSEEISQLCHDAVSSSNTDGAIELIKTTTPIDECAMAELQSKVLNVPAHFADLCLQAFTTRQEIIDWLKELIERSENGSGECMERVARYNAQGLELCESLRTMKNRADDAVNSISQVTRRAVRERGALAVVGESLVREIARLREDLETYSNSVKELQETRNEILSNHGKPVEELHRDLEEERSQRVALKDKLATAEAQLRQTRMRIAKMDRQLRESEASLTNTVKALEDQSRQKELSLEARARKLKESLKTGEVTSNQLSQQRDQLQAEVQDLKQQIETMTAQHKTAVQDLTTKLKDTKETLENKYKTNQNSIMQKADAAMSEAQSTIEALKTKISRLENIKTNQDLPTEREMELWAELQTTKETLRSTEDEITTCKRDKIRFLETLTKITESDNKVGMQQKLASELLSKEEILGKLQVQIRELTKTIKLNEQKVIQYEQYVRDLQEHNRAIANCQDMPESINCQDLQQEVMNLRLGLLESVHQNEDLSEQLQQKDQQIEQQDKTSRAQARVIKVREELINMLKNKETEQSLELASLQQDLEHRMKIVDEVNKQIAAKADEIQELFATLENKQQQIHRLEKIVLALEEQQRRAQAQRMRHEEKIASLEHKLASDNRKERKFLFF